MIAALFIKTNCVYFGLLTEQSGALTKAEISTYWLP
jgi:hypothetical protein